MNFFALRNMATYGRFLLQDKRKQIFSILHPKPISVWTNEQPSISQNSIIFPLSRMIPFNPLTNPFCLDESEPQKSQTANLSLNENRIQHRIKGICYEGNAQIQDRLVIHQLQSIEGYTVSVFDGHGGALLADYAANKINQLIEHFISKHMEQYGGENEKLIKDCLKWAYNCLQENFYEDVYKEQMNLQNKKLKNIGTCGLTLLIHGNKIYTANCGDSQAIVVSRKNQKIEYIKLNQRLSVNNPQQRQRLYSEFPQESDIITEEMKGCYYLKGRLQPTRTIGDYHLKKKQHWKGKGQYNGPYLSHVPQINVIAIEQQYKSIVIASDGIWDFLDKWAVTRLSFQDQPHKAILNQTLKKVAQMHNKEEQEIRQMNAGQRRSYHDDIALAVIGLQGLLD